ncbi:MAG: hypothetical protein ACRDYC_03195, partial [Acidimicrobiales bacterium]
PSGCTSSANGSPAGSDASFCGVVDVAINDTTDNTCIVGTTGPCAPSLASNLTALGTTPLTVPVPLAAGASKTFTFTTEIDPSATNADMNLQVSDPLTWSFTA